MSDVQCTEKLIQKKDVVHLAILIGIALAIGVYLIVTTVLISKDGVFYIERAQQLASDPIKIIKAHPPGFPFLIMAAHKCAALFTNGSSVFTWIYSAQAVTLLCRLLALIPLYFIGKLLVGSKNSFLALLILIFLPFPAKAACEVLREWPYLLFLLTGFFFLIGSAKSGKWWWFGLVGISGGLGYWIRPESAQLLVYGFLWGGVSLFRPKLWDVHRWKILSALALLIVGFAIPAAPYMNYKSEIISPNVNRIMKSFSFNALQDKMDAPKGDTDSTNINTAEIMPSKTLKAFADIFSTIGENLMWFFLPALMIGLYYRFRGDAESEEIFFITTFVLASIIMLMLRYYYIQPHVSQRWTLPLVTFTIFYVPVGLQVVGKWMNNKCASARQRTDIPNRRRISWFVILFVIGIGICMPKLLRPIGIGKHGYREVAKWLRQNTDIEDVISTPDNRIAFYANRLTTRMQMCRNTIDGGQVTSENWYHIVGSYDGKYQKLYVNGKLVSSAETGFGLLDAGRDDLAIGKPYARHESYFKGLIKDVRIYGKALPCEDAKALSNQQIPEVEKGVLIGYWPLGGDSTEVNAMSGGDMVFDGIKDYIDLSKSGARFNVEEITVSVSVKTEKLKRMNWILGNSGQFRIGIYNSKVHFWIQERSPGHKIPVDATYLIELTNEKTRELNIKFNKKVQEKKSVWVDKKKKKKRVVIYEVL